MTKTKICGSIRAISKGFERWLFVAKYFFEGVLCVSNETNERVLEIVLGSYDWELKEITIRINERYKNARTVTFHCPDETNPADQIQVVQVTEGNPWLPTIQDMESKGEYQREVKNPAIEGRMFIILPKPKE